MKRDYNTNPLTPEEAETELRKIDHAPSGSIEPDGYIGNITYAIALQGGRDHEAHAHNSGAYFCNEPLTQRRSTALTTALDTLEQIRYR